MITGSCSELKPSMITRYSSKVGCRFVVTTKLLQ